MLNTGSHSEKTALKDSDHFAYIYMFLSSRGFKLDKLPEFFHILVINWTRCLTESRPFGGSVRVSLGFI